jgi:hypothetical protein
MPEAVPSVTETAVEPERHGPRHALGRHGTTDGMESASDILARHQIEDDEPSRQKSRS